MKTLAIDRRFVLNFLFAILITIFCFQMIYAGNGGNEVKKEIIIHSDGIARIVDSNGIISLSPADRKIEKDEIKFGAAIVNEIAVGLENAERKYSQKRGGEVCEIDDLHLIAMENTFSNDNAIVNNSIVK